MTLRHLFRVTDFRGEPGERIPRGEWAEPGDKLSCDKRGKESTPKYCTDSDGCFVAREIARAIRGDE